MVQQAIEFNHPVVVHKKPKAQGILDGSQAMALFTLTSASHHARCTLVLNNVKLREEPLRNGAHAFVLRLYEAYGARGRAHITR